MIESPRQIPLVQAHTLYFTNRTAQKTTPAEAGVIVENSVYLPVTHSEVDSTAASANDTNAPKSNRVTQTPKQNKKITTERTSTFMVVTLCNIIFEKNNSPYINHKTARGCGVTK
ncbi:MAG: hypothetical protein Q7T48_02460 [Cellvibrio sp.]|uniref:hypothetical protein n=1 Tax=Cellvibrio sp. TaxID=1965322 RepID=UPI002725DBEB|nr:hypothetical protein [Cellvibrio sp.]